VKASFETARAGLLRMRASFSLILRCEASKDEAIIEE
jgi:hypothetical protein